MLQRNETLIKTKLLQYLIPSIMTNMALQVGNIVDTILVGNILGANAMSAVQIGGTVLLFIQIPGWMLGIGGSIVAGNCLGKRDVAGASKVFSSCLFATVFSGILLMCCAIWSEPAALLLTGGGSVLTADVAAVVRVTFLGTPVIGIALLMINFMSVDNNPALSTAYVVISNVVNLAADYVLLSFTPIGAAGSTVSTVLGYGLALIVIIFYARSKKRMLRLVNPLRESGQYFRMAFVTGVPALLSIVCEMIRNSTMNVLILRLVGEDGVAVYTICLNVVMIVELFLGGIVEAMDKIGGVIFGERDYFGIVSLTKNILRYCYGLLAVILVLLFAFTRQAAELFGIADPSLLSLSDTALKIFLLALPGYVCNRFFISYYQTTEHSGYANLITVLEYCGMLLPAVAVFSLVAGALGMSTLNAMMLGLVAGEFLTAAVTMLAVKLQHRGEGLLLLPETREEVLDVSVGADIAEASLIPREIIAFCKGKADSKRANQLAVAAEEMAVNAIHYGGKGFGSIDVMLSISDEKMILRMRDNGLPFDPTDYTFDQNDDYSYSGIETVRALTDRITYLRMLDFNNTTLELATE